MADLPHPWRAYAHLQNRLDRNSRLGNWSWALEAGVNFIVDKTTNGTAPSSDEIARSIRSESRRERNRAALRQQHLPHGEPAFDPVPMIEALSELSRIQAKLSSADWKIMTAIGQGRGYSEIAALSGVSDAATRVRIMRLRRHVISKAA